MDDKSCHAGKPVRIINGSAPIRICDNGGWTDTWFAKYGNIFNIAVYPFAEVQIEVYPQEDDTPNISIFAENYGERYVVESENLKYDKHPLIEAALERMYVPKNISICVSIYSEAPIGSSTGTSASVTVALIGALDRLTPGRLTPHEVAHIAHEVETRMLNQQCGIQDQLSAAYGGINYIEMFDYPYASVSKINVSNEIWWELERRLVLIYLGKSHSSSKIHEQLIKDLHDSGPDSKGISDLRLTAPKARDALYCGDFTALGKSMIENTEAQANLHPALVGNDALKVIDIAKEYGAVGWKVNGAGGDGGSITLLCGDQSYSKRSLIKAIEQENNLYKNITIYISHHGLRVWDNTQFM